MKLSSGGKRFAAGSALGLTLAVISVMFAFGVPEQSGGCGGGAPQMADDAEEAADLTATVCAAQHTGKTHEGDAVIVCDKVFPAAPSVRPPADKSGKSMYLAL